MCSLFNKCPINFNVWQVCLKRSQLTIKWFLVNKYGGNSDGEIVGIHGKCSFMKIF